MEKTMKAVVYKGKGQVVLEDRPIPVIQDPRDAIVRVTRSTICSSDLHIKHGTVPRAKENTVLGHEFVGEVVEVGSTVKKFKAGDRVSVNVETFCGECFFCKRGYVNNCVEGGWEQAIGLPASAKLNLRILLWYWAQAPQVFVPL